MVPRQWEWRFTDPLVTLLSPLKPLQEKENKLQRARIEQLVGEYQIRKIVLVIQSIWTDQQESVQSLRLRLKQC